MYAIEILHRAQKQLEKIDVVNAERIIAAVEGLAEDPRPAGAKKLAGRSAWRIRVGAYRVLYEIQDRRLIVLVVAIGHRGDVYRH